MTDAVGGGVPLAAYRIHFAERRVRATPALDLDGEPFGGPPVELRPADAALAIAAASPVVAWLDAREPGVRVRSLSVRTREPRVLVSLEPLEPGARPRALRFEPPYATELREAALASEAAIGRASAGVLAARRRGAANEGSFRRGA